MKKILCIGFSATFQRTISFNSLELEKVNRSTHYRLDASGKAANSARVLAQLEKGCVELFCPLGSKDYMDFVELAEKDNLNISYITYPGKTRLCCTLLDSSKNTTTELVIGEPALQPDNSLSNAALAKIKELIAGVDGVILSGSRPANWAPELYPQIVRHAVENNRLMLADFIGPDLINTLELATPSIIKINEEEFIKTFMNDTACVPAEVLKEQITKKSLELKNMIVVTRGSEATFAAMNGKFYECPVQKLTPVNTIACGDSFNAGFIYEYLNTGSFEDALKKGTWCAAQNAMSECPGALRGQEN